MELTLFNQYNLPQLLVRGDDFCWTKIVSTVKSRGRLTYLCLVNNVIELQYVPSISERDKLEVKSVFLETKDNPINSSVPFIDNDSGLDFTVESQNSEQARFMLSLIWLGVG